MEQDLTPVKPGSVWQHHSGIFYRVLAIANNTLNPKPNYPPTVIYRGPNGNLWSGPLSDWHRRMTWITDTPQNRPDQDFYIGPVLSLIHI